MGSKIEFDRMGESTYDSEAELAEQEAENYNRLSADNATWDIRLSADDIEREIRQAELAFAESISQEMSMPGRDFDGQGCLKCGSLSLDHQIFSVFKEPICADCKVSSNHPFE